MSHRRLAWIAVVWLGLVTFLNADTSQPGYWTLPIPAQGAPTAGTLWPASSLDPEACALCHQKQFNEWRTSWHAKATSPGLLGQLDTFDEETRTMCLNCHAPRTEQQTALAKAAEGMPKGIDCAGCHVRGQKRFGPRDRPLTPHGPVLAEPLFWSSAFCAACHQFDRGDVSVNNKLLENTLSEWQASRYARDGTTCQGCHMPEGSHRFPGIHNPDMLRQGLALEVTRTPEGVIAKLTNERAGHALPTYITPRIRLLLYGPESSNTAQLVIQRAMEWHPDSGWHERFDTRLMPGESRRLRLPLEPDATARAEVVVEPDADYHDRVYPYLLGNLQDEISATALAQLRSAHAAAASSHYIAYQVDCSAARDKSYRCGP